jgi:hypothetical protein
MIITFSLLILFTIINSFFKELFKKQSKKISLVLSITLLILSTLASLQGISLPGFQDIEKINILKTLFSLLLITSMLFDTSKEVLFRKIISLFLILSNNIEFQGTFLLTSLVVEKILKNTQISLRNYSMLLLLILTFLGGDFFGQGQSVIALVFAAFLFNEELAKSNRPEPVNALFYSIVILVFLKNESISLAMLIPLIILSILNLLNTGKRLLRLEGDRFSSFLSLTFLFMSVLALTGLNQLFYFIGAFLFLGVISRLLLKTNSIHWDIFFLIFFFSPPFGIGYMSRTEVFEKVVIQPWYILALVCLYTLLLQLFTLLIVINSENSFIESIKKFKLSTDIKASLFIVVSVLFSLLFLPDNWLEGYGNLFKVKLFPESIILDNYFGIGYYLFWVELVIWLSLTFIYYKTSPDFFKRIYTLNILLNRCLPKKVITDLKIVPGHRIQSNNFSAKDLVSALELSRNRIPPQYFTLVMILALGMFLAGLV